MLAQLRTFLSRITGNIFFFAAVLFLGLGFSVYYLLGRDATDSLIKEALNRKEVVAKSGAASIKSFFDLTGKSVVLLAANPEVSSFGPRAQENLDEFIKAWEDTPVVETILVDEEGIVRFVANREGEGEMGVSVADREYFVWGKEAEKGEVFVSQPVRARLGIIEGQFVVPVATPVYDRSGNFRGVLAAGVELSRLTESFLNPLKSSPETEVYLLRTDGTLFYAPWEELWGENAFDYIRKYPFLGSGLLADFVKKELEKAEASGRVDVVYPVEPRGTSLERRLMGYSRIEVGDRVWILAVATPVEEVLALATPPYARGILVLIVSFLALTVFTIRFAKVRGFKEGFGAHGEFHEEKDHKASSS